MQEIWKDIKGYEGYYQVSNLGRVKNIKGKILKAYDNGKGYKKVDFKGNKMYLHRLVAIAFIPNPYNKPCVNHINSNKSENFYENLEWCTYSENMKHSYKVGTIKHNGKGRNFKINEKDVIKIREMYKTNLYTYEKIAKLYNITKSNVYNIIKFKTWKNVKEVN